MELARIVVESDFKGIGLICIYQEALLPLIKNPLNKFSKLANLVNTDKEYVMNGFSEEQEMNELIKLHLSDQYNTLLNIDSLIIKILLQKSFKGLPLFILDLVDNLLESKLINFTSNSILPSTELIEMNKRNDWKAFNVPIRIEKVLGNIIDSLSAREIIILKYASVIGNIFDLEKLNKIIPFNNVTVDDLYLMLQKFEVKLLFLNQIVIWDYRIFE